MEVRAGLVPAFQDQTANPVIGGTQDFANFLVNFPVSKVQTYTVIWCRSFLCFWAPFHVCSQTVQGGTETMNQIFN